MEQNEGRCAIDLAPVWVPVSSVPTKISNSSGTNPFPVLINRRSPSHWLLLISLLLIYQLSLLLSFAWFAPSYRRSFSSFVLLSFDFPPICFHLCRVSQEKHASLCRGWQTAPGSTEPSFICRHTPAGGRVKAIFTKDHSKQTLTFFCRRGRGNEISRWLQDQFYCSKCLLIISGEWDMDYIDPMSWMNWKYIELIRIIQ